LRLTYKGPTKEDDFFEKPDNFYADYGYDCIKEFNVNPFMKACMVITSGKLELRKTILSLTDLGKDIAEKVPCLVALEDTTILVQKCTFKGNVEELNTSGILSIDPKMV